MAVAKSVTKVPGHIWIPPQYTANFKATVERADGTIDDITDLIISMTIEDGVTESIGSFEFEIPNPNETYNGLWTGMEIFRYYCDYASGEPTTLRFRGRIEKPSNRNNNLLVTGRSEALFVQDQHVHKVYESQDVGYIIKDLFDTYGQGRYDTSEIDTSTGTALDLTFVDIPFWDVIEDICIAAGYDCYVAPDLVIKFFEAGSITNTTDAIVHDFNLVEVGEFAPDLSVVRNQIRVIGGTTGGVQVMYTANDLTSQAANGIRREVVNDDGITTMAAAKEYAEFLLEEKKDPPITGEVKGILLATIQPGEKIRISSPYENIEPNGYRIISYAHDFGDNGLYTTVRINKESRKISHVLKASIQRQHKKSDATGNVDDLDYAQIELFDTPIGSMSGTEITDGVLKLQEGESTGTWISQPYGTFDDNIFENVMIELQGDNLPGATIQVSYDNGINYTTVTRDQLLTLGVGTSVVVKLTLSENTQIDSLAVKYSKL